MDIFTEKCNQILGTIKEVSEDDVRRAHLRVKNNRKYKKLPASAWAKINSKELSQDRRLQDSPEDYRDPEDINLKSRYMSADEYRLKQAQDDLRYGDHGARPSRYYGPQRHLDQKKYQRD